MIRKDIEIDGRLVPFKASAAVPRMYRLKFGRDIFKDLRRLKDATQSNDEENSGIEISDLELFENAAYIMAKHADPGIPNDIDEWLEQFAVFSIYEILPEILDLWGMNMQTESESMKKKKEFLTAR